jgi:hypothetical protein
MSVEATPVTPEAVFTYVDERGQPLFEVVRMPGKKFWQRKPDGAPGLDGVRRVPYRLDEIVLAEQVFLVEGERDVETLRKLGLIASTNPGGANGWRPEFAEYFRGKHVVVLPDQDTPGHAWAARALRDLTPVAKSLRRINLPGLEFGSGGDISDWLAAGHTKGELLNLVEQSEFFPPVSINAGDALEDSTIPAWPEPLAAEAFHGLAGEIVRAIEPHSEADPAGLLIQFLAAFGNVVGASPHFRVEADRHGTNIFVVLVGVTSVARKGTSLGHIRRIFQSADSEWAAGRVLSGLSSGEGLIWAVRDAIEKRESVREKGRVVRYERVIADDGVPDKRALVVETEFSSPLRVAQREGNTLSATLRDSWDIGNLCTLTKNSPARATGAHISIIGHVTREELLRYLNSTEMGNGFANRFLWLCVRRSKCLPDGGNFRIEEHPDLLGRLKDSLAFAHSAAEIRRDDAAADMWRAVYEKLSDGRPGLLGSIISRAPAQVVRLALIFALLDSSPLIREKHMLAALAVWQYCEASARFIFGDSLGYPDADRILKELRAEAKGLTRTEIRDLFGRNRSEAELEAALRCLAERGLAGCVVRQTGGRSAEVWKVAVGTTKTTNTTKG